MDTTPDGVAETPQSAYEIAGNAFNSLATFREAVDALWRMAYTAGKRGAALAIRAEAIERRRLAKDALDSQQDGDPEAERHKLRFLAQATALERVADQLEGALNA